MRSERCNCERRCEIESGGSDEDSQDEKWLSILKGTLDVLDEI